MDFMKKIRWGIGKDEVHLILRDKQFVGEHPGKNAVGYYDSIYGVDTGIVCYFNRGLFGSDKLARVNIIFFRERPEDETIEKTYTQIKSELIGQYGNPTHKVDYNKEIPHDIRLSEQLVWVVSDSILTLSLGLKRNGVLEDGPCIDIGYGDIKNDPISKLWDWLK